MATVAIAVLRQDPEVDELLDAIASTPRALAQTLEAEGRAATRLVQDPLFKPRRSQTFRLSLLVRLRPICWSSPTTIPTALETSLDLPWGVTRHAFLDVFAGAEEQDRLDALERDRA